MSWRIFDKLAEPHGRLINLPPAPPWRAFGRDLPLVAPLQGELEFSEEDAARGATFRATDTLVDAVNASLYLRRPLLVTGKPGSGKSSLAYAVAYQLRMGRVLKWTITSRTNFREGLYTYDAIGRLNERTAGTGGGAAADDIGKFLELGPLGTALLPSDWPRALLIDEIDNGDLDLPNDLLTIIEDGEYSIPELQRAKESRVGVKTWKSSRTFEIERGFIKCRQFPFVVLTSNGEREFPSAFLRRCIRITIGEPEDAASMLRDIVRAHLGADLALAAESLIEEFRTKGPQELATDQLLNAVYLVADDKKGLADEDRKRIAELLLKPLGTIEMT